jgi:hypothetical protein
MQLLSWTAICTAVKKMATPLQKAKDVLLFNKIKCVKQEQQCYQTEFRVDPPSDGSIYAFYKQLYETGCFVGRGSSFCFKLCGWNGMPKLMCGVTNNAYVEHLR